MYMSDWIETLDGFLKLSKHEILTQAEKDYIDALEDIEINLLGGSDKK